MYALQRLLFTSDDIFYVQSCFLLVSFIKQMRMNESMYGRIPVQNGLDSITEMLRRWISDLLTTRFSLDDKTSGPFERFLKCFPGETN